jgi:hypothetical protein
MIKRQTWKRSPYTAKQRQNRQDWPLWLKEVLRRSDNTLHVTGMSRRYIHSLKQGNIASPSYDKTESLYLLWRELWYKKLRENGCTREHAGYLLDNFQSTDFHNEIKNRRRIAGLIAEQRALEPEDEGERPTVKTVLRGMAHSWNETVEDWEVYVDEQRYFA